MFDWIKKITTPKSQLDVVDENFATMLELGCRMFRAATEALLGRRAVDEVRPEIFATDSDIDQREQKLRRHLIIHASVRESADVPTCLVLMSIAKDAERIGDYCKNIFDLAVLQRIGQAHPFITTIDGIAVPLLLALTEIGSIYEKKDEDGARRLLKRLSVLEDRCDEVIDRLVDGSDARGTAAESVVAAMSARYQKRIASHAMNILTSIVMPVDKLDFFDER